MALGRRFVGGGLVTLACAFVGAACTAQVGSGTPGVPHDAATPPPADASVPIDADHHDAPAFDAGIACAPGDVSMFVANWMPPVGPYTGDCTDDQLNQLIGDCFDTTMATATACSGWLADTANSSCVGCFAGPVTAKQWAPLVYTVNGGEVNYVNVGGCVALATPTDAMCGEAIQAHLTCDIAACVINCPIPQDDNAPAFKSAVSALQACFDAADQGGCQNLAAHAAPCVALADASPTSFCFAATTDLEALRRVFAQACGVEPVATHDAGED